MADPQIIQSGYKAGMKRDFPRDAMPKDSLWNVQDFLPETISARLRKRGGYEYVSQDINAVQGTATYLTAGIFSPYTDGDSILVFDEDNRVYEVESAAATENIGAALVTRDPVFYNNFTIVPDSAGSVGPKKITRAAGAHTIANLAGSPPAGKYAVVYKDVLWLAGSAALLDRIYFGKAGDPETWDTTNKWLDNSYPISGMAALANAVFIFSLGRTTRIRGSIPPPDSDFIVDDPIFDVGCTDNRSITNYRDKVIWANAGGLYISDGTAMEDLTRICGMKQWWLEMMAGNEGFSTGSSYTVTGWTIATGVMGDFLFYSVMNGSTKVDSGMIDMTRYTWYRIKNIDATFMFKRPYPDEVFWTRRGAARLSKVTSFLRPLAANKADADGTAVEPLLETAYIGDPRLKTLRRLYVNYDIRDAASDNPILTASHILSPEATSYTALSPTMPETTESTRVHIPINKASSGIAFKIAQTGNSSDTRMYELELEAGVREGMK